RAAPSGMSIDTSRSAQIVELIFPLDAVWTSSLLPRTSLIFEATRSPSVRARPVRYFLVTLSSWMAREDISLNDIREVLIHPLEHHERRREQHAGDRGGHPHDAPVGRAAEDER